MQGVAIPISMVPGESFLHKINPLPKLVWALGVLVISFATRNPAVLGAVFLIGVLITIASGIFIQYLKVVAILFPISLTLIVMQSIAPAFPRPWTPIVPLGPFTIWQEGVYSGVSLLLRIMAMTTWALLMVMTSHPSDIFTSLQKVGMPFVGNFILTMTLQLIPILQREFGVVLNAQKSRGMKGTGFAAILPSMVPVFVGAIERVQQLSISLESRAFGSAGNKTSYREVTLALMDYLVLISGVIISALVTYWVVVDKSLDWSETLIFSPTVSLILFFGSAIGFLAFVLVALKVVLSA
jgi:energy-coupling factor transport system permease protein